MFLVLFVCYSSQHSSKLMIPGRITCPQSWTEEYEGYLMTTRSSHKHNNVYECVDKLEKLFLVKHVILMVLYSIMLVQFAMLVYLVHHMWLTE